MTLQLALQLGLAGLMVCLTLATHLYGLRAIEGLRWFHRERFTSFGPHADRFIGVLGMTLGLVAVHGIEIWQYTFLYLKLGAAPTLEEALYFSIATYSTVGYGDVVLSHDWRVLGAIEAVNGILLLGWSTAFVLTVLQDERRRDEARPGRRRKVL